MEKLLSVISFFFNVALDAPMQILMAELVFLWRLPKRKGGLLWLIPIIIVCIVLEYFVGIPSKFSYAMGYYFGFFVLSICGMYFCFQGCLHEILFLCLSGYCLQNMSFNIAQMQRLLPFNLTSEISHFSTSIIILFVECITYFCAHFAFTRRFKSNAELREITAPSVTIMTGAILSIAIVLNWTLGRDASDPMRFVSERLLMAGCNLLLLMVQLDLLARNKLKSELLVIQQLWKKDQQRYEIERRNIDLINMKCHDLRHILHLLDPKSRSDFYAELEESAQIMDTIYHTGNIALDTILTEKALVCEKQEIQFSCIVDGDALCMLTDTDIFSIMSNVLDNAIEAVLEITNTAQRIISLRIYGKDSMSIIHIENYFSTELCYEGEALITTKEDSQFHGFGLKSIQYLVDKYNGNVSISADDSIFILNIAIPRNVMKTQEVRK